MNPETKARLENVVAAATTEQIIGFADNFAGAAGWSWESIDEARAFVLGTIEQSMIEDGPDGPCPDVETAAALLGVTL